MYLVLKRMSVFAIFTFLLVNLMNAQSKFTEYVDPMIGTGGHGHTYPGAALPFGLVQLSPDTDNTGWDWCSGYHYSDNSIMGFSHTHLSGTGCADYGDILFMPTTGEIKTIPGSKENPDEGYRSRFSHDNEFASPGYYSVKLDDYNINVELTVSRRVGFHKYTFPKSEDSHILIDLVHGIEDKATDAKIEVLNNKTVQGYRRSSGWAKDHTVYFYAEFSKPFDSYVLYNDTEEINECSELKSEKIKAVFNYSTKDNETILVKVGISHTNIENAKLNLETEVPNWDFEDVKKKAEEIWNEELAQISVETESTSDKTVFYTAMYHALLNPNTFSDVNEEYMGMDKKVHKTDAGEIYTVFSLWDTFRAAHPLFTIIDKEQANDMVKTLIKKYEENGLLPVWELAGNETGTMIGYHAIPVIYDAYSKGIRDYDVEEAFEAMKKSAMEDHLGLKYYKAMGYISSDLENESVSKTLEYAYDDWCIAMMAKDLGKEDDYKYFIERAQFYKNLFDNSTNLMRPKKNGRWFEPFDPFSVSGNYTEANAWQYSFFVPQDVSGLITLMGGVDGFNAKLDELFTVSPKITGREQPDISGLIGQYAHGNEPSHHMAYLYNYSGQPWKTQERIHEIVNTMYTDQPDGLSGNEDCGQMSAWYVLSAAGFYPVTPGDTKYIIGTPNFDKLTLNCDGNLFTVVANNLSDENYYIQSATLNGKDYKYSYINHNDIVKGGELVFEMGSSRSEWGSATEYRPVSKIDAPFEKVPYFVSGERVFRNTTDIEIKSLDPNSKIYYTTDGSEPKESKTVYPGKFTIDKTTTVKAVCEKDGVYSKVVTSVYNKLKYGSIKLSTMFHENYTGGGELGLIDGIKGELNFRTDAWQGYEGVDLDAVVDLSETKSISEIDVSFLQDTRSWIFFPKEIEYYVSEDGVKFTKVYSTSNSSKKKDIVEGIKDFTAKIETVKCRYVKVIAKNLKEAPEWHLAPGGTTWIFVDEITIK